MGLDFFGAAKHVNGRKIDCDITIRKEFGISAGVNYRNPRFRALWWFDARELVGALRSKRPGLIERCYNRASSDRNRNYHAEGVQLELLRVPTMSLPPVTQPDAALQLADDLDATGLDPALAASEFLRFWASRGHPVFSHY